MLMRNSETSHKLTLCAMLCLLSMVILFFVRHVPLWAELPLIILAGIPLAGVSAEEDILLCVLAYAITAIFGLGFVASYAHLGPFVLFFGWYPLIKPIFDSRGDVFFRWVIKMILYTIAMYFMVDGCAGGALMPYLNSIPWYGLIPLVYVLFVAYDYLLLLFQYFYLGSIRPRL
ncbi:MAG: hypothetical protein E7328_03080 [Clostridiales bacterium]|nr:hypothetical protein [Clostridiales bacterium]